MVFLGGIKYNQVVIDQFKATHVGNEITGNEVVTEEVVELGLNLLKNKHSIKHFFLSFMLKHSMFKEVIASNIVTRTLEVVNGTDNNNVARNTGYLLTLVAQKSVVQEAAEAVRIAESATPVAVVHDADGQAELDFICNSLE